MPIDGWRVRRELIRSRAWLAVPDGGGKPAFRGLASTADPNKRDFPAGGIRQSFDGSLLKRLWKIAEIKPAIVNERVECRTNDFIGERTLIGAVVPLKRRREMVAQDR